MNRSAQAQALINIRNGCALILALMLALVEAAAAAPAEERGFDQRTILKEANEFFGAGAEGLGKAVEKAFADLGRPNGYIKGTEVAGAVGVGLRYGEGVLQLKDGSQHKLYWHGPSIGFDVGANAAKTFVLVYGLPKADAIFQRFPGVAGSLYFVAGVGMNYLQKDDIRLAPIRFGVGWRQGANVGYTEFTREKTINPF